eukprot:s992_g23.t1
MYKYRGVAAAALYFKKKKVFYYMDKIPKKKAPEYAYKALDYVQDNPHLAMYVLIAVSFVSLLGILISCCCSGARKHRPMGYDSITERVWCCAARTTSRMGGRRDDARTACCAYQPLQQVESRRALNAQRLRARLEVEALDLPGITICLLSVVLTT